VLLRAWWSAEAVGVAVEGEDDGAVREAVQEDGGDGAAAEGFRPQDPMALLLVRTMDVLR